MATPKKALVSLFAKPDELSLEQWQIALRKQIADKDHFYIEPVDNSFGEYIVYSPKNGNQYKVTYRGENSPWNFCSCMDFKTSRLGTCKHIEAVKLTKPKIVLELPSYSSVYLNYSGEEREVKIRIGYENKAEISEIAKKYFTSKNTLKTDAYNIFDSFVKEISEYDVKIYHDALDFITRQRDARKRADILEKRYSDEELDHILKAKLYPYQKEGVRFAFKNGKAIIADEMGLGKTVQGICAAELFRKEGLAQNALIVCPTSLKYQWKREIEKFTGLNDVLVIEGNHLVRMEAYKKDNFYKIVSYNSLCNDIKIEKEMTVDLLIFDEVQRLKNWNTQIAKAMRKIDSIYSVILSGTPLENKLEDLYSIIQMADQFCLGPYYKFRAEHILTSESGKVLGYQKLNSIKDKLANVLIRRKKSEVQLQLPGRIDKNLLIPITEVQMGMHDEFKASVSKIANKWHTMKFLSETDRLRLMMLLANMRMVCDSTFLLDQKSRDDTKVDEVVNIVKEIIESTDEKVVIFSQWERMTRIIAAEIKKYEIKYEYLFGGVPSSKRKALIDNFTDDPDTRVFLSTDAGGVGLNLQAASVIINVDLPWNPAVLEQRIARIWRIGQNRSIQVINLIAQGTIEEGMISRLKFKSAMAEGVLDGGEDTIFMDDDKFSKIIDTIGAYLTEKDDNIVYTDGEVIVDSPETIETVTEEDIELPVTRIEKEAIHKGIDFMTKIQTLLSSKSVCNMLIGAMAMEDPEHIQDHIADLENNKQNIEQLINLFKNLS